MRKKSLKGHGLETHLNKLHPKKLLLEVEGLRKLLRIQIAAAVFTLTMTLTTMSTWETDHLKSTIRINNKITLYNCFIIFKIL